MDMTGVHWTRRGVQRTSQDGGTMDMTGTMDITGWGYNGHDRGTLDMTGGTTDITGWGYNGHDGYNGHHRLGVQQAVGTMDRTGQGYNRLGTRQDGGTMCLGCNGH